MNIDDDDDDFDFNFDDLSDEEMKEMEKQHDEKRERVYKHPLFIKAQEILTLVEAIAASLSEDDREIHMSTLRESAMILAPKLAGAMGSDSWLICMQNAALIRYHASYLLVSNHLLKELDNADNNYIKVFRQEMEEFRALFNEWAKEIQQMEREEYEDEWGLFMRD